MTNINAIRLLDSDQLSDFITKNAAVFFSGGSATLKEDIQIRFTTFLDRRFTGNLQSDLEECMK